MAEEQTPQAEEQQPEHRKYVRIFVCVIVAMVALSFIIMAFRGSGPPPQKKKDEPLQQSTISPSMQDFNRKVESEINRRNRMNKAQEQQAGAKQAFDQAADSVPDHAPPADQTSDEKTPEEIFKEQERKRALVSRISQPKWLGKNSMSKASSAGFSEGEATAPGGDVLAKRKKIDQMYDTVNQQIELLLDQTKGQGAQKSLASPKSKQVIVGKPKGEEVPSADYRLISTGTVISAVLDQMTVSDYIGGYRARIAQDVYDASGNNIMIPKGAKIVGKSVRISNVNEAIQARMGLPAVWIVLPNGQRISLEKTSTLDQSGIPAVKDKVDRHLLEQILGVAAYAMIATETSRSGSGYANDNTAEGELGDAYRKQFAPLIGKYLNLVPTITLQPGTPLKLFIEDDIYAKPWKSVYGRIISKRLGGKGVTQ